MTCGREIGYTCSDNPKLKDPGCGEHFASLEAFDRHHTTGDRQVCLSARQMLRRGFRRKENGTWSIRAPMSEPAQTSFGLRGGRRRTPRKNPRVARRAARTPSPAKDPIPVPESSLPMTGEDFSS